MLSWSYKRLRGLRSRYLAGESVADLSEEQGCSPKSLTAAWSYHGITRDMPRSNHRRMDWTMSGLRSIRDRWLAGETLQSLAIEIGSEVSTLDSALTRAGFKSPEIAEARRARLRHERNGLAVQKAYILRRDSEHSWRQIAEIVGWDRSVVHLRGEVRKFVARADLPPPPRRSRSGRALE